MVNFGIDLDGVCFDWHYFVDWHNNVYGTLFTKKDFMSEGFCERFDIPFRVLERRVLGMFKTVGSRNLTPASGAVSSVRELSKMGKTLAVTARPSWCHEDTLYWIRANFNGAFNGGVHFTRNHHFNNTSHLQTKLEVCLREGVSYLIEDDLKYALPCAERGIRVILFDYYRDRSKLPDKVHPVYSWTEALDKIKELEIR